MKTFDSSRFFVSDPDKGIVRTPEVLAQEMISNIPEYIFESSTTNFLDPACGRGTFLIQITKKLKSYGHSWENITSRIFGIDIDPFSGIKQAQYILGSKNIIVQDFLEMSFPENWPKEFDVIISNPPYKSNQDLKFLSKSFDLAKERVIFVHPGTYIVEKKSAFAPFVEIRKKIEDKIESIEIFNGNGIFKIGLYVPCCITSINKKKTKDEFHLTDRMNNQTLTLPQSEISKITLFGYNKVWNQFSDLVSKESKSRGNIHDIGFINKKNRGLKNENSFYVEFTRITAGNNRGSHLLASDKIHNKDFFIIISKYQLTVKSGENPKYDIWYEFDSENKAKNFLSYITTDFVRACLATKKFAQSLNGGELKNIPIVSFEEEWNDEKLYKLFNVTEEQQKTIREIILPYYD